MSEPSHRGKRVLVYVQALPATVQSNSSARDSTLGFETAFRDSDYVLSHSSRLAISRALEINGAEVIAVGFQSVLRQALVAGAASAIPVPLCSDPMEQISSFPETGESLLLVGECPNGFFTGATLAGGLSRRFGLELGVWERGSTAEYRPRCVILVKDMCEHPTMADIRRIRNASESAFTPQELRGTLRITPERDTSELPRRSRSFGAEKGSGNVLLAGDLEQQSLALRKRLRRMMTQ